MLGSACKIHSLALTTPSQGYGVPNAAEAAEQCDSDSGWFGRLACLDFALASFYGQGITMNPMGSYLVRA